MRSISYFGQDVLIIKMAFKQNDLGVTSAFGAGNT